MSGSGPVFDVPNSLDLTSRLALDGSELRQLLELNEQVFFDLVVVFYAKYETAPASVAIHDSSEGFSSFCRLIKAFICAETENGFGQGKGTNGITDALQRHLGVRGRDFRPRDIYGSDGSKQTSVLTALMMDFARLIAIKGFAKGASNISRIPDRLAASRDRLIAATSGRTSLLKVPQASREQAFRR